MAASVLFTAAVGSGWLAGTHQQSCQLPLATSFSYGLPAGSRSLSVWPLTLGFCWGSARPFAHKLLVKKPPVGRALPESRQAGGGPSLPEQSGWPEDALPALRGACPSLRPRCSWRVWGSASSVDTWIILKPSRTSAQ